MVCSTMIWDAKRLLGEGLATTRCVRGVLMSLVAVVLLVWSSHAQAQTIGLGGALLFDEGTMHGERQASVQRTDLTYDFVNETFISGSLWMLFPVGEHFRMGGAYTYLGSYDLRRSDVDGDDAVDELGVTMEFLAHAEWLLPISADFDLILGAQGGLAMLIPGGQLEDDIAAYQQQGVSVVGGPRFGYVVGPMFGVRYAINEMFAFRSDFAVRWQQLFLFLTNESVGDTPFFLSQNANILRYEVALGIEVSF